MTKPVKVEPELLNAARHVIIERCKGRLDPVTNDDGSIGGFADPAFVDRFGVGMHKLPDSQILSLALGALIEKVEASPEGKTGLRWIDD